MPKKKVVDYVKDDKQFSMTTDEATRKYERVVAKIPETFGIKKSAVSKKFIRASAKKLDNIDGAKGPRKGIVDSLGDKAIIQRCQRHKRENIVKYLPKGQQGRMRRKLQEAYQKPKYAEAKAALGVGQEEGMWGLRGTGVKSHGDLAANYGGLLMYQDLLDGRGATEAWDEGTNCSSFRSKEYAKIVAEAAKKNSPTTSATSKNSSPPTDPFFKKT